MPRFPARMTGLPALAALVITSCLGCESPGWVDLSAPATAVDGGAVLRITAGAATGLIARSVIGGGWFGVFAMVLTVIEVAPVIRATLEELEAYDPH